MLFVLLLGFVAATRIPGGMEYGMAGLEVTDDTIARELEKGPLLLVFYLGFLGANKRFVPLWNEVVKRLDDSKAGVTAGIVDMMYNHQSKHRFDVRDFPALVFLKDGEVFRFPKTGVELLKNSSTIVQTLLDFVDRTHLDESSKRQKIPRDPHIPQWFKSHDFINKDKVYKGAVF